MDNFSLFTDNYFICCCSVDKSFPTLWDPIDCRMPSFPVVHYLPEFAQTHVLGVSDAIQPSHSLSPPSPPALNLSWHQDFSNELALSIRSPKYWSFSFSISPSNEYSGLVSLGLTGLSSSLSKGLSRVFSRVFWTTVQKHFFNNLPFFPQWTFLNFLMRRRWF